MTLIVYVAREGESMWHILRAHQPNGEACHVTRCGQEFIRVEFLYAYTTEKPPPNRCETCWNLACTAIGIRP